MHNGNLWHTVVLLYTHKEILQLDSWEDLVPVDYCIQVHKEPIMKKSLAFFFGGGEHFFYSQLTMGNQEKKFNYSMTVQVMAQSLTEVSYINSKQTIVIQNYIYDL